MPIQNIINLILFMDAIYLIIYKKYDALFILTIVSITIAPLFDLGYNIKIPFYYLSFVYLMIYLTLSLNKVAIKRNDLFNLYLLLKVIYLIISIGMTLYVISNVSFQRVDVSSIISLIIKLGILFVSYDILNKCRNKVLVFYISISIIVILNFAAGLYQFATDDIRIFYQFYTSATNNNLEIFLNGNISRIPGLFSSPITLGAYSVVFFAYLLALENNNKHKLILIAFNVINGIFSLSKTAILGIPIVCILFILYYIFIKQTSTSKKLMFLFFIIFFLLVCIYGISILQEFMEGYGLYAKYYFKYIFRPFDAFKTRYSVSNDILLNPTYKIIKEYPLLGSGFTVIRNEFLGDSTYVMLMKTGGLIGLVGYILFNVILIIKLLFKRNTKFIIVISIMLIGFSGSFYHSLLVNILYMYILINSKVNIFQCSSKSARVYALNV